MLILFGLYIINCFGSDINNQILNPIGAHLPNVPKLVDEYVVTLWPSISQEVVQVLWKMLVLESSRGTAQEVLDLVHELGWETKQSDSRDTPKNRKYV